MPCFEYLNPGYEQGHDNADDDPDTHEEQCHDQCRAWAGDSGRRRARRKND
jgi:hypothetical protein